MLPGGPWLARARRRARSRALRARSFSWPDAGLVLLRLARLRTVPLLDPLGLLLGVLALGDQADDVVPGGLGLGLEPCDDLDLRGCVLWPSSPRRRAAALTSSSRTCEQQLGGGQVVIGPGLGADDDAPALVARAPGRPGSRH